MLIGELARQAGVSRDTVRFYTALAWFRLSHARPAPGFTPTMTKARLSSSGASRSPSRSASLSPSSAPSPPRTSRAPWTTASSASCWPPSWSRSKTSGANSARWRSSSAPNSKTWNQRRAAPEAPAWSRTQFIGHPRTDCAMTRYRCSLVTNPRSYTVPR